MSEETRTRRNRQWQVLRASQFIAATALGSCACDAGGQGKASSERLGWDQAALSRLHPQDAASLLRLGLANAVTRALADDSAKQGPVTAEELSSWTAYYWAQVDRPAVFRTTHAVVRVEASAAPADVGKAERVANAIGAAVAGAPDTEAFKERAKTVPTEGLEVKVEALDFVAEDGRVMRLGAKPSAQAGAYDPAFARAAAALSTVGQISPPTRSSFGFHVIRLEETLPPVHVEEAVRRDMAREDVLDRRARLLLQGLLTAEKTRSNPVVERSAEEATAKVSVE